MGVGQKSVPHYIILIVTRGQNTDEETGTEMRRDGEPEDMPIRSAATSETQLSMCTPAEPCPVQRCPASWMGPVNGRRPLKATSRREGASAFGTNDSSSVEGNLNLYRVVREGEKN